MDAARHGGSQVGGLRWASLLSTFVARAPPRDIQMLTGPDGVLPDL